MRHHLYKIRQFLPEHQATLNFSGKPWVQDEQGQKRDVSVEQRAGLNSHLVVNSLVSLVCLQTIIIT